MPDNAFTETLELVRCNNWNTESCPHIKNPNMQLTIINRPHWFLLNDQTVEEINRLCGSCVGLIDQKLVEELIFEVFQDPGFHEPLESYEPHSIETGDFNGDNIQDMAILVHDKLIIYIGE